MGLGTGEVHPGVEDEVKIREMEVESMMSESAYTTRPSSQPSFIEPPHTKTSPHQAPHAPDHAPWMDLFAQISLLGTCMEELAVVSDT
ncbi:hypothetical protein CK203_030088 [Vitis vinifera]|uniref:Uncharacterized protein n=1 Tax=Vitis vinifera TaxID=29760 RepID=A0A438IK94_VITVI|nr:hypothetical protein CK203_030088 [Vitis vinifera]